MLKLGGDAAHALSQQLGEMEARMKEAEAITERIFGLFDAIENEEVDGVDLGVGSFGGGSFCFHCGASLVVAAPLEVQYFSLQPVQY